MQLEYSPAPVEFVEITTTVNEIDTQGTVTPMMQIDPESPQTPMTTATTTPQSIDVTITELENLIGEMTVSRFAALSSPAPACRFGEFLELLWGNNITDCDGGKESVISIFLFFIFYFLFFIFYFLNFVNSLLACTKDVEGFLSGKENFYFYFFIFLLFIINTNFPYI